jgi:glycosyltransferase 2 family protein
MKMKALRKWLQMTGFLLGAAILIYQAWSGINALLAKQISISFSAQLLFAFIFVMIAYAFQMIAWSDAMKSLQVFLGTRDVFKGYLLSFLPRYIPGTIWGYISRSEWLYQQYQVPYKISYQGSVVETFAAIVANIILVANFAYNPDINHHLLILALSIGLPFLLWYLIGLISKLSLPDKFYLSKFVRALFPDMSLRYWLTSILWFFLVWCFYGLGLMFLSSLLFGTENTLSFSNWMTFSSVYAIAWLVGFLILFAPAGLGFREIALTSLLSSQLGISLGIGSALAVLFRLIMLLSEIIWLGFSLLLKTKAPSGAAEKV